MFKKKRQRLEEDDDFEFEDADLYRGEPDLKYSHELLVMEQIRRCLKAGSQEMKKGWEERKVDRMGNTMTIKTHPDTRKEYAECVDSLVDIMMGFIIPDPIHAKEDIEKLYQELKRVESYYINLEQESWNKIPNNIKKYGSNWADRWDHIDGTLNYDHIYGEKYLQQSISIYRKIFQSIMSLLHRMGYFKAELLQAAV